MSPEESEQSTTKSNPPDHERASIASNDEHIFVQIPKLISEHEQFGKIPGSTALFISQGHMWSMLAHIPVETALRVNINENQLAADKEWETVIQSAKNIDEILAIAEKQGQKAALEKEMRSLGHFHYLYSDENLRKTQEAMNSTEIRYVQGDLTDSNFLRAQAAALVEKGERVIFADMTNVMDWILRLQPDRGPTQTQADLTLLPFHEKCNFLYSVTPPGHRMGRSPRRNGVVSGLQNYVSYSTQKKTPIN